MYLLGRKNSVSHTSLGSKHLFQYPRFLSSEVAYKDVHEFTRLFLVVILHRFFPVGSLCKRPLCREETITYKEMVKTKKISYIFNKFVVQT